MSDEGRDPEWDAAQDAQDALDDAREERAGLWNGVPDGHLDTYAIDGREPG